MTTSKKWVTICVAAGLIAACTLAAPPSAGAALTVKDSAAFDWKYEMDLKPSEENLDGNVDDFGQPYYDFTEGQKHSGAASVADGILTITSSRNDHLYYNSYAENELWPYQVFNLADGYTFETRMKIVGVSTGHDGHGSIVIYPSPADSTENAFLSIADDEMWWSNSWTSISTEVNNDDFHVFRVAMEETTPGSGVGVYHVWRDGALLSGDGLSFGATIDINRMIFGDAGDHWGTGPDGEGVGGWVDVDYFRFTEGAWAPDYTPPPDPIPGDANEDDVVDDVDASILASHWQQSGGWSDGDFNNDGIVNDQDASIMAAHWGETREGSTSPVPEPSTLVLLGGIGLLGLVGLARRRQ